MVRGRWQHLGGNSLLDMDSRPGAKVQQTAGKLLVGVGQQFAGR